MTNDLELINDADAGRYRLMQGDDQIGYVEYDPVGADAILIKHTEVLPAHGGKGFGAELVRRVLDDVRAQGRSVIPVCPYALNFVRKHPDYHDLVREDLRRTL